MRAFVAVVLILFAWCATADTIESPPFVIDFDAQDAETAERSARVLREAMGAYGVHLPSGDDPIRVTIVSSNEAFANAFGIDDARNIQGFASGGDFLVMKPPRLLRPGSNYDAVLRHELVHVLIARNTNPENMPRWFNEGIAMLVSNEIEWSGPTTVAFMYLRGGLIPYTRLHEAFEDPRDEQSFGEAYAQSQSMARFLYDTLGEDGFWSFILRLRELSFNDALLERTGMTPFAFDAAWRDSLRYTAWGSWAVSGFFVFQIAAFLTIVAWWRRRRYGRAKFREWALEDAVNAVFEEKGIESEGAPDKLDEFLDEWEDEEEGRWQ